MHPHDDVRRAGAVQIPRKGQLCRFPHSAAFPVTDDKLRLFIPRLHHAGNEVPPVVRKGKRRRYRLVQDQGAGGVVEHDPRLPPDEGEVENRLPRPLPRVEDGRVCVADGIGGGVHPSAHDNPLPKAPEDGAVIRHFQVRLLRGRVRDVHAEIPPLLPAAQVGARAVPAGNKHLPAPAGGIREHRVRIRRGFVEPP